MAIKNIFVKLYIGFMITTAFATSANATATPESFSDLVEQLTPAVVNISTTQTVEAGSDQLGGLFQFRGPDGEELEDIPELFKKFYGLPDGSGEGGEGAKRQETSLGSGFVISEDGYIVTNNHVVEKAEEINVIFNDDTKAVAKLVGSDAKTDIAVLKIDVKKKLKFVKFGNSDKSRVGDWVIAIGNPFGLGGSVSAGIISARARDINAGPFDDFIQTDAAINRGNSGGPLFNTDGEVIGVNSAIFSPSGGNVGIGFAVPTTLAEPVIQQLITTGHIKRGWLGVKIQTVTDEIAESIGLKEVKGALVLDVDKDSPADRAGVKTGDVISSFDGKEVGTMRKLPRIVAETPVGKKVPVIVWRNGQEKALVVTIALLDESEDKENKLSKDDSGEDSKPSKAELTIAGIGIKSIDKNAITKFKIDKAATGVIIVEIDPKSEAAAKSIRAGDIISAINQTQISSVAEAKQVFDVAINSGRKSILLLLSRGGETLFVAVPTGKK